MLQTWTKLVATAAVLAAVFACQASEATQRSDGDQTASDELDPRQALTSEPPPPAPKPKVAGPGELDPRVVYKVPLRGNEPQMGPDEALITIVEFADFDCPFCKSRASTMVELHEKYGPDLRVVWLNYPLPSHRNARAAATAALEAQAQKGDAAFWKMHDKLLENQGSLTRETLERLAKELRLDMRKFRRALDHDKHGAELDRTYALGNKLHIPGTPSYFMNGRFMAGFPLQTWSFAIDRHIASLKQNIKSGQVSKTELYERLIADGQEAP